MDGPNPSAPAVTFEPSSTVDDEDDAPTKVKRMDQLPTETVFVDTDKFEVLRKNSNHDENSWRSNRKWALKSSEFFPAPSHSRLGFKELEAELFAITLAAVHSFAN